VCDCFSLNCEVRVRCSELTASRCVWLFLTELWGEGQVFRTYCTPLCVTVSHWTVRWGSGVQNLLHATVCDCFSLNCEVRVRCSELTARRCVWRKVGVDKTTNTSGSFIKVGSVTQLILLSTGLCDTEIRTYVFRSWVQITRLLTSAPMCLHAIQKKRVRNKYRTVTFLWFHVVFQR